jgi:formate dehydrogenase maturation protein FdhE
MIMSKENRSTVTSLKKYTNPEDIEHVMHSRQEIEQIHKCPVCGDLQVISGIAIHTKAIEDHDVLQR